MLACDSSADTPQRRSTGTIYGPVNSSRTCNQGSHPMVALKYLHVAIYQNFVQRRQHLILNVEGSGSRDVDCKDSQSNTLRMRTSRSLCVSTKVDDMKRRMVISYSHKKIDDETRSPSHDHSQRISPMKRPASLYLSSQPWFDRD